MRRMTAAALGPAGAANFCYEFTATSYIFGNEFETASGPSYTVYYNIKAASSRSVIF